MQISHKTQAALQFLVPTAVVYVAFGALLLNGQWPGWAALKENSSAFAIIGIAAMLVQDLIPKPIKEFLVFWRRDERLPGHRAFSEIAFKNPSIDLASIQDIGRLKDCCGEEQQREFYKRYNLVRDHPAVSHASQRYIAWRDTSVLLFLLFCVSLPVFWTIDHPRAEFVGLILSGVSAFCFLLTVISARGSANSLTVQVLSLPTPKETINGQ